MNLERLIAELPSAAMREALAQQKPEFALKLIKEFNAAPERAQAEIIAFFEADGPRRIEEIKSRWRSN